MRYAGTSPVTPKETLFHIGTAFGGFVILCALAFSSLATLWGALYYPESRFALLKITGIPLLGFFAHFMRNKIYAIPFFVALACALPDYIHSCEDASRSPSDDPEDDYFLYLAGPFMLGMALVALQSPPKLWNADPEGDREQSRTRGWSRR